MLGRLTLRFGFAILSILGATTIVFGIGRLSGDPAKLMAPPGAPFEQIDRTREALGLDRPLHEQYGSFIVDVLTGDLGSSYYWKSDVSDLIANHYGATLRLAGAATLYAALVGIPLGLVAAINRGRRLDRVLVNAAMLGQAIPSFWLGPILILVFAVRFGVLPTSGMRDANSLVLPAITLGSFQLAVMFRITRAAALEALGQDYVRLARSKGMSMRRLAIMHVLPNTALPLLTVGGLALAAMIGGSVIVETIFAWPGLGNVMIQSVLRRDFPVVQGVALVFAIAFVVINTLVDALYLVVDPRLRAEVQR